MKFIHPTAKYLRRFFTTFFDIGWVSILAIGFLFALVERRSDNYFYFIYPSYFYLWCLAVLFLLFFSHVGIPLLTKGKTLGMFLTKTKLEWTGSLLQTLFRRELFFGLAWCFLVVLVMIFINHTLADQFARSNQQKIDYSDLDRLRIGIVATSGGLIIILQFYCVAGIIARADRRGFNDRFSNSRTVIINRWIATNVERVVYIKPQLVHNEVVEWVDE